MIGTSRSFEHNSYAKNRAHLQPVVKSDDGHPWWATLATMLIVLIVATIFFGKALS